MKYNIPARIIHWSMALIIIFLLGLGIYMTGFLSKDAPNRMDIYNLHKSLGVLVMFLFIARFINRFVNKPPALPKTMKKSEKFASHSAHILLYLFMILVPLSGYLMSNSYGYMVEFFNIKMPLLAEKNFDLASTYATLHKYIAYLLISVISLHILGALKHKFFDKPEHDVMKRMI